MSFRRVVAMTIAIAGHLVLLALILRPSSGRINVTHVVEDPEAAIELRLIPARRNTLPALPLHSDHPRIPSRSIRADKLHAAHVPANPGKPINESRSSPGSSTASLAPTLTTVVAPDQPAAAGYPTADKGAPGDGGFSKQLLDAQDSRHVHGVPGSDTHIAPGIQLTDPTSQGIGALMRNTQRLFGITNRHCIDVEIWASLTPDELVARHLSPADVKRANEKYDCHRPLGLNF